MYATFAHSFLLSHAHTLRVSVMNNATVHLVGCTTVPGVGWMQGYCAEAPQQTHIYTQTHTHTFTEAQCSVSRWRFSFFRSRARTLSTPPSSFIWMQESTSPPRKKNKTTKQSPSCTSPSHAHIHTLQANIPSFAQIYHTPSGVLRACTPTQSVALPASPWRKLEFASVREKARRGEAGRKRGLGCTFHEMLHQKQARKYCFTMLVYVRNCSFWKSLRKIRRRRSLWIVFWDLKRLQIIS